jgi:hypothetical protein
MAMGVVETVPHLLTAFEAIQKLLKGSESHQHLWFRRTSSILFHDPSVMAHVPWPIRSLIQNTEK